MGWWVALPLHRNCRRCHWTESCCCCTAFTGSLTHGLELHCVGEAHFKTSHKVYTGGRAGAALCWRSTLQNCTQGAHMWESWSCTVLGKHTSKLHTRCAQVGGLELHCVGGAHFKTVHKVRTSGRAGAALCWGITLQNCTQGAHKWEGWSCTVLLEHTSKLFTRCARVGDLELHCVGGAHFKTVHNW